MDPSQPDLKKSLQAAVRYVADEYLRDPNITSIGIGYKVVGGERTNELAFQFTVSQKVAPEDLGTAGTRPIPAELTAGGITLPTDVLEREFRPHPIAVQPEPKSIRKRRLDPMRPGIGIGHIATSGGTLGCLVEDAATRELQMLSNWHVLGGAAAEPGDVIVQPCRYDDDRVDQNHAGVLVRSHLGLGGDCAIAHPVERSVGELVLDLDVAVRRIGDPELDDVVVKSGRTSEVTFGRVTRLHTITKLRYPEVGEKQIGGFEIGPDPAHPAERGEISMPGDSGSVWLAVDAHGRVTDMMLGLHFAGELVEPAEWAAACYASAVFEKLEIRPLSGAPSTGSSAGAPEAVSQGGDEAPDLPLDRADGGPHQVRIAEEADMVDDDYDDDNIETNMGDPASITTGPEDPPVEEAEPEALGGLLVKLCKRAEEHYGLRVAECDAPGAPSRWGPVHPVHAQGSLHYAHRAADISGLPVSMNRFTKWVAVHHTPNLAELIHQPGGSVKNGAHVDKSFWGAATWAAHANHVHLAI